MRGAVSSATGATDEKPRRKQAYQPGAFGRARQPRGGPIAELSFIAGKRPGERERHAEYRTLTRLEGLQRALEQARPGHAWPQVRSGLVAYLRARGARPDLAEDVAQETVARLIAISREKEIGSVYALAFRIADNMIVDRHRAESRFAEAPDREWRSELPSLDRVLDSRRAIEVLQRCLESMPPLRREVLERRRIRHESCRKIGEDLSLSMKAVEKHITRGLIDLRRAMERAGIDPAEWKG